LLDSHMANSLSISSRSNTTPNISPNTFLSSSSLANNIRNSLYPNSNMSVPNSRADSICSNPYTNPYQSNLMDIFLSNRFTDSSPKIRLVEERSKVSTKVN
jgi:hypothetical protein